VKQAFTENEIVRTQDGCRTSQRLREMPYACNALYSHVSSKPAGS
jgi:hypothetical protein